MATEKSVWVPRIGKILLEEQDTIFERNEYVQCGVLGMLGSGVVNDVGGNYLQYQAARDHRDKSLG